MQTANAVLSLLLLQRGNLTEYRTEMRYEICLIKIKQKHPVYYRAFNRFDAVRVT